MNIKKIIRESIQKVIFENDEDNYLSGIKEFEEDENAEMCGTDEEFDAFMKWAMTKGNDYGFGEAAGDYVNGGDSSKLYMIAMQYGKKVGINPEIVFNMAKEAAEGIYAFMGNNFKKPIDTRNMTQN